MSLKKVVLTRCSKSVPDAIETKLDSKAIPIAGSGWIGHRDEGEMGPLNVSDLLGPGYRMKLIDWDGRWVPSSIPTSKVLTYARSSRPIIDTDRRVVGVLGGQPQDPKWQNDVVDPITTAFKEGGAKARFTPNQKDHRRGPFAAVAAGISYGGGQRVSPLLTRCVDC